MVRGSAEGLHNGCFTLSSPFNAFSIVRAEDPFWIGPSGSRLPLVMKALGKGILQHNVNVDEQEAGDEDVDDDNAEELFDDATLEKLRRFFGEAVSSPLGMALRSAASGLPKKVKETLAEMGLSV